MNRTVKMGVHCSMLRFVLTCVLSIFLIECASAQNYLFSPSANYSGQLSMDMYTEHYMYIAHNLPDTAYITWRVVENTCPEEWDIQACDYQHCYTGLPNNGDMNGVPPGGQGYLRMIVNPFSTAGSGMLHLLIYPTGQPSQYTEAFFNFETSTSNIAVTEVDTESVLFLPNEIQYSGIQGGNLQLYNLNGCLIEIEKNTNTTGRISLSGLSAGVFILRTPKRRSYIFYNQSN